MLIKCYCVIHFCKDLSICEKGQKLELDVMNV